MAGVAAPVPRVLIVRYIPAEALPAIGSGPSSWGGLGVRCSEGSNQHAAQEAKP